jgi:hypothetical protein
LYLQMVKQLVQVEVFLELELEHLYLQVIVQVLPRKNQYQLVKLRLCHLVVLHYLNRLKKMVLQIQY